MTVEHRILIGLADIKSISFQCDNCNYRVTVSPEDIKEVPFGCSNNHHWEHGEREHPNATPSMHFFSYLAKLRFLNSQRSLGFQVLLEIDEPRAG